MGCRIVTGRRHRSRAFTLIELLVVMVIIASLLAIAVPRYFRSLDRSKEVVLAQDLAVMRESIDRYLSDRGKYPESLEELVDARYLRSLPVDPITKTAESWVLEQSDDPDLSGIRDVRSGATGQTSEGIEYGAL
jgi:general secretion pathway protein G